MLILHRALLDSNIMVMPYSVEKRPRLLNLVFMVNKNWQSVANRSWRLVIYQSSAVMFMHMCMHKTTCVCTKLKLVRSVKFVCHSIGVSPY